MRAALLACLLLACPGAMQAQERPLFDLSPGATHAAAVASNAMLAGQAAIEAIRSVRAEHPWQAVGCQGLRLGVAFGAGEGIKRLVRRTRPDGSDRMSFPSQHAAVAFSQGGWRVSYSFFLGAGVGVGRMAARKHYPTDVLAGSLLGLSTQFLPPCRGR